MDCAADPLPAARILRAAAVINFDDEGHACFGRFAVPNGLAEFSEGLQPGLQSTSDGLQPGTFLVPGVVFFSKSSNPGVGVSHASF